MTENALSVIMANYNHGHFIKESLEAIAQQSLTPKEVIVIDDGSTDDSVAVIERISMQYPFVKLFRNSSNCGVNYSLNRALEHCTGDYVFFTAADDKILPGFFEKSMRLLSQHPEAGLCCTLAMLLGEKGETLGRYHTPVVSKEARYLSPREVLSAYTRNGSWILTYSAIFRSDAVRELGGADPEMGPSSDALLMHIVSMKYGACFIPEPLVAWRRMESGYGISFTSNFEVNLNLQDRLAERLRSTNLFPPQYLDVLKRQAAFETIYDLNSRRGHRYDRIAALGQRLASPTLIDRAFFLAMRLYLEFGYYFTKLYLFSRHGIKDQKRLFLRKLKRQFSETSQ